MVTLRNRLAESENSPLERRAYLASTMVDFDLDEAGEAHRIDSIFVPSEDIKTSGNRAAEVAAESYLDGIRLAKLNQKPLQDDGTLHPETQQHIDDSLKLLKDVRERAKNPVSNANQVIITIGGLKANVHKSFLNNAKNNVSPQKWVDLFRAVVQYIQQQHPEVILAGLEPINEPDWNGNYGGKDHWNKILQKIQDDPLLGQFNIIGPSTLSADNFSSWYQSTKDNLDWAASHWLGGSLENYKKSITKPINDGKIAYNSELHSLAEFIIGAELGVQAAATWQALTLNEATFVKASTEGTQLAYQEGPKGTVAAVYKMPHENKAYFFIAQAERKGGKEEFVFNSSDGQLFSVDGGAPTTSFSVTTKDHKGEVFEITWGETLAAAPAAPFV